MLFKLIFLRSRNVTVHVASLCCACLWSYDWHNLRAILCALTSVIMSAFQKGYYSVNSMRKSNKSWLTCNVQQWDQPLRYDLVWCSHLQEYWELSWDHQVHHDQASLCSETDIYCVVRLLPVKMRWKTLKENTTGAYSQNIPFYACNKLFVFRLLKLSGGFIRRV